MYTDCTCWLQNIQYLDTTELRLYITQKIKYMIVLFMEFFITLKRYKLKLMNICKGVSYIR